MQWNLFKVDAFRYKKVTNQQILAFYFFRLSGLERVSLTYYSPVLLF